MEKAKRSDAARKEAFLNIWVATLTRKRPRMLATLLQSWAKLAIPEHCAVTFLVVENDDTASSRAVVEEHRSLFLSSELRYVLEPELGIPFGRNRAAREAIAGGGDLLVFMDDDEFAPEDWLLRLIAGYRRGSAVLMGAPLRASKPEGHLSLWQRVIFDDIARRYAKKEKRASRLADEWRNDGVTIVTNNWLAELSLFTAHGIWFDEALRFTGGEDAEFSAETKRRGLPLGWVPDAPVYETVPRDRLTFVYQYRRGRDQSNIHFRRKLQRNRWMMLSVLFLVPVKLVGAIVLGLGVPLTGGYTLLEFARTSGWIAGRISALFGIRSELYVNVTGE